MNDQMKIAAASPFAIGAGLRIRNGRDAWIVSCEPVDTQGGIIRRQVLLIGGPRPMAEILWNVRIVDDGGNLSQHDEHTVARMLEQSPPIPVCADPAALLAKALDKQERALEAFRAEQAAAAVARKQAADDVTRYAPAWAKAAIVAELHQDDSDSMTDYFNHKTSRVVVIAWSKHERDLFPEMRKAAALFPETADLADAPESAEHREKYSMGAGFYLKRGWRDSSGWCVKKRAIRHLSGDVLEFSDVAKGERSAPAPAVASDAPAPTMANAAGLFRMSQHIHTKKGWPFWICELVERVEREDFDRFLSAAKALGGWYSRPWAGTPGGFAFKQEAAALEFTGQGGGDGPDGGAPTDEASRAPAAAKPAPIPAANPADKLRTMADAMQAAIDDKFRDRLSNTPKRARQAAEARNDGTRLERAQKIMRALAAAHDAGTVPACLARVTTRKAIEDLAKEEITHGGGYYDAGTPTGKPYDWHRIGKPGMAEQAAAAWALLVSPTDKKRAADEELRRKLEALQFAKIPGYFPTPAGLVARMIREADILPGARVLEPSAGSGAIADAVKAAGHNVECVERHASLCEILAAKGHRVSAGDFLTMPPLAGGYYDAAIMNPPFENGQDLAHVRHAWDWIKPGGSLVAIMGAGVTFRQDRRYSDFREWAESVGGTFEEIPAGTFKESGTGVASTLFHAIKAEG